MKKLTKLAAMFAAVTALFCVGCSNVNVSEVTVAGTSKAETRTISFAVTSSEKLIDFSTQEIAVNPNVASRSILPEVTAVDKFWYFLCSKKIGTDTSFGTPIVVQVEPVKKDDGTPSESEGTVVINLSKANYEFELFAVKKNDGETSAPIATLNSESTLISNASLRAVAHADLRYDDNVNFYLTADGLIKAGNIALGLYAKGWDPADFDGYTVTADLTYTKSYTKDTTTKVEGDQVDGTGTGLGTTGSMACTDFPGAAPADGAENFNVAVVPGTYNFNLYFTKDSDTTKKFVWSDRIVVLPNQTTKQSIGIPLVIDKAPVEPASFKAAYVDDTDNAQYYSLEFVWADSSSNESNFQIEIAPVASTIGDTLSVQPTTDEEWDNVYAQVKNAGDKSTVYGNSSKKYGPDPKIDVEGFGGNLQAYISGSLGKNHTVAVFKAAYGVRYMARIRAVNEVGESKWVYCTLTDDLAEDTDSGAIDATHFYSDLINRYKISYNLSSGTLTPAPAKITPTYICSQIKVSRTSAGEGATSDYFDIETDGSKTYWNYTGGVNIMQPDGDTDYEYDPADASNKLPKPTLILNGTKNWTNWTKDGKDYNPIGSFVKPYGGCEDIVLVANFATVGHVYIFDDNNYAIASVASAKGFSDDGNKNYYVTLSQETDKKDTWTITYPTGVTYDRVTLRLYKTNDKNVYYDVAYKKDTKTFELPITEWKTGIYRAEICAYNAVKPKDPYTIQIITTIKD